MKNIFYAFLVIVGLSSCTKELDTAAKSNSKWVLVAWPGKALPTTAQATLNISEGNRIGGKAFCNTYGGNASFNGNSIQFSQFFSTKMYCNELSEAEAKFTADLESVNAGKVSGGKLSLMKDGQVLMVFSRAQ